MPMIEADPKAERIQKEREQKLVLFSASVLKRVDEIKTRISQIKQLDFQASHPQVMEKLVSLMEVGRSIEDLMKHYELKRFGDVILSSQINFIDNTFSSLISYGKNRRFFADSDLLEALNNVLERVNLIAETAQTKLGVTPEGRLLTIKNAREKLAAKKQEILSKPLQVNAKVRGFRDLAETTNRAGKSIKELVEDRNDALEAIEAEDSKLIIEETRLKSMSLQESIANNNVERVSQIVRGESRDFVQQVRNSGLGSTRAYVLLKGAVIITGRLNPTSFRNAGFAVFEMSSQFILMDQIILALVRPDSSERHEKYSTITVRGEKSESPKAKVKHPQGLGQNLTTQEVLNILAAKGENYIDVASASLDRMTPYELHHPEIKDITFVWLMKKSDFLKASQGNPIKIRNVQLPTTTSKASEKQAESLKERLERQRQQTAKQKEARELEADIKRQTLIQKQQRLDEKRRFEKSIVKPVKRK